MILVTGGLGMIGASTAAALADLGEDVIVTGHRTTDVPSFLTGRVVIENLDVTDRAAFLALGDRYAIRDIVHLAGSIPDADPVDFFRSDLSGLLNVLEAARAWQVRRLAVASSISVYEGRDERPWTEDLALPSVRPPHAIAALKKAAEPIVLSALDGTGVHPVLLRIGSTWGPLMHPESPFNPVPALVSAVLRGERPAALRAEDGGDFGYARDTGRAIALLMTTAELGHVVYNVGSGFPYSHRELADSLGAALPGAGIEVVGDTEGAVRHPFLDIGRLRAETGFEPEFDVSSAVADYVAWRSSNGR